MRREGVDALILAQGTTALSTGASLRCLMRSTSTKRCSLAAFERPRAVLRSEEQAEDCGRRLLASTESQKWTPVAKPFIDVLPSIEAQGRPTLGRAPGRIRWRPDGDALLDP
mgnify:CR=1 FL=1